MHPAGGQAGTSVDVILGGYDWTPDMQIFSHDPRIKIELTGPPSPVLVPDPPYWFGAKARGPAWPLAREFPARITIPADIPPGLVRWQVANANGASPVGLLHVESIPQVLDSDISRGTEPQPLPALPVVVSGQVCKIEEVDRYSFRPTANGPITVSLIARQLSSPLHAMLQVRDEQGAVVADVSDTEGRDLSFTFAGKAGTNYVITLHDADFAGDRSYVYRLSIHPGPQVMAAFPLTGVAGETRSVEFIGWGIATGTATLESVRREVTFPPGQSSFPYRLETAHGVAQPFELCIGTLADDVEPANSSEMSVQRIPFAVTGSLETRFGHDDYRVTLAKNSKLRIEANSRSSQQTSSPAVTPSSAPPLDLHLTIVGPDGKELVNMDDQKGSTDPSLVLNVPADGEYRIRVGDQSGHSGSRAAWYRLSIAPLTEQFFVTMPPLLNIPLGGKAKFTATVTRQDDFKGALELKFSGLPVGITIPPEVTIPADKNELELEFNCAPDALLQLR